MVKGSAASGGWQTGREFFEIETRSLGGSSTVDGKPCRDGSIFRHGRGATLAPGFMSNSFYFRYCLEISVVSYEKNSFITD